MQWTGRVQEFQTHGPEYPSAARCLGKWVSVAHHVEGLHSLTLGLGLGGIVVRANTVDATRHGGGRVSATAGESQSGLPTQALSTGDRRRRHAAILGARDGRVDDLVVRRRRHGVVQLLLVSVWLLLLGQVGVRWCLSWLRRVLLLLVTRRAAARALQRGTRRRTASSTP